MSSCLEHAFVGVAFGHRSYLRCRRCIFVSIANLKSATNMANIRPSTWDLDCGAGYQASCDLSDLVQDNYCHDFILFNSK